MLMEAKSKAQRAGRAAKKRSIEATVLAALTAFGLIVALESRGSAAPFREFNGVSLARLRDVTPPSAPEVAVTEVGPTHVSLAWWAIDDGPHLWYTVYQNGVPIYPLIGADSATAYLLLPGATYTFTVRARDFGGNFSALSEPVTVTTPGIVVADTVAPTVPTNLISDVFDNEISLRWSASSDDHDVQNLINYEISLNGELVDVAVGGRTSSIVYGVNGLNLVSIVAVDSSGNASTAVSALIAVEF